MTAKKIIETVRVIIARFGWQRTAIAGIEPSSASDRVAMLRVVSDRDIDEATVTIDGVALTTPQVLSLRVAVGQFLIDLSDPEFLRDMGPAGLNYQKHLQDIELMLASHANRRSR